VTTPLQDIVDEGLARRDDPLLLRLVHRRRTGRDLDQRFENGTDGARVDFLVELRGFKLMAIAA